MLFNPDFWDKLTEKQRMFLVLHEIGHYINSSFIISKEFSLVNNINNNIIEEYSN
jgi:Zn-dependent peptidase ImmA (M78 family)